MPESTWAGIRLDGAKHSICTEERASKAAEGTYRSPVATPFYIVERGEEIKSICRKTSG